MEKFNVDGAKSINIPGPRKLRAHKHDECRAPLKKNAHIVERKSPRSVHKYLGKLLMRDNLPTPTHIMDGVNVISSFVTSSYYDNMALVSKSFSDVDVTLHDAGKECLGSAGCSLVKLGWNMSSA